MILVVMFLFSFAFVIFGILHRKHVRKIQSDGVKTLAEIMKYEAKVEEYNDGDFTTYYYPYFRFVNEEGEIVELLHSSGLTRKPKGSLPRKKEIFYLKSEEGEYDIVINSKLWTVYIPNTFICFGGVSAILILTVYILHNVLVLI